MTYTEEFKILKDYVAKRNTILKNYPKGSEIASKEIS